MLGARARAGTTRPSILALTRQAVPALRNDAGENRSARGAYVLAEAEGARDHAARDRLRGRIAMTAREQLEAKGIAAAVVSMPCWAALRGAGRSLSPQRARHRAARRDRGRRGFGWNRYIGDRGRFIGMHDFGASAPIEALYPHFGITAEAVVEAALSLV